MVSVAGVNVEVNIGSGVTGVDVGVVRREVESGVRDALRQMTKVIEGAG